MAMALPNNAWAFGHMFTLLFYIFTVDASSSSSRPVRNDSEVFRALEWTIHEPDYFYGNTSGKPKKNDLLYHSRKPIEEHEIEIKGDASVSKLTQIGHGNSKCPLELELLWSTKLGSSIYSAPIVKRSMFGDGGVQIVAPTFVRYLELIEGSDGLAPTGWPLAFDVEDRQHEGTDDFLFDDIPNNPGGVNEDGSAKNGKNRIHFNNKKGPSIFHGSAALHDVNDDGIDDILIADGDGNLYWVAVGDYGKYLHDYRITVPKLRLRKDWYHGLDFDYTDRYIDLSMFHHHGDGGDDIPVERIGEDLYGGGADDVAIQRNGGQMKRASEAETLAGHSNGNVHRRDSIRKLLNIEEEEEEGEGGVDFGDGGPGVLDDLYENYGLKGGRSFDDHYGSQGYGLDDTLPVQNESDWIYVDAHVLGTPTVADIDGDGHVEILVGVSYFFDRVNGHSASPDVDPSKYVAGGVACYDLQAQEWVWKVHLDLTTDEGKWRAYVFAAPSVADLDGDGSSEVIIGTGLGLLYALDAASGFVLKGFPIQMGEIQGQAAIADVVVKDGTGDLEILVADMSGNLLCVNREGEVLWDRQFPGSSAATPTIGDIDGDGFLDVALTITTKNGALLLYAVRGEDGEDLANFPIRLSNSDQSGSLTPPVLLVDLHGVSAGLTDPYPNEQNLKIQDFIQSQNGEIDNEGGIKDNKDKGLRGKTSHEASELGPAPLGGWKKGLHLVVPTCDGKLHVIEGGSGCLNHIDVGEHIYAMPLVEDVKGDGLLDLVVSTMNGELMALGTSVPFHPLNAWGSMPNNGGRNGFTHMKHFGVFLYDMGGIREDASDGSAISTEIFEVNERFVSVTFEIVDKRIMFLNEKQKGSSSKTDQHDNIGDDDELVRSANKHFNNIQSYDVSISLGSNTVHPIYQSKFTSPGIYSVDIELPSPMIAVIRLLVINEHGQSSTTGFTVAYNMNAFSFMKYIVLLPFLLASIPLILVPDKRWKPKVFDLPLN